MKKETKGRGRPKLGQSPAAVIRHMQQTAPPSFTDKLTGATVVDSSATQCPICLSSVDRPLELACGSVVCMDCCCASVSIGDSLSCPCCYDHDLSEDTVNAPSSRMTDLFEAAMKVHCHTCQGVFFLSEHREHTCHLNSPSRLSVQQILDRPVTAPPHPVESRVAEHLVRRLIVQGTTDTITIPTQGKVS